MFNEVSTIRTARPKCRSCGKVRRRSVKERQTVNPWNKDKDGRPKTGQEIWEELDKSAAEKVAAIEREGIICKPCSEARDQAPTNPEDDGA